jgi:hypothetical protein
MKHSKVPRTHFVKRKTKSGTKITVRRPKKGRRAK